MKEQEKELSKLKGSLVHEPGRLDIKSPHPLHFRSTAKWNHEDDFLAKYLSKEPTKPYFFIKYINMIEMTMMKSMFMNYDFMSKKKRYYI